MAFNRISTILQSTTVLVAATFGTSALAQSTANLIFAVDESGSMAGEQTFLGNFASDIDTALSGAGFSTVNFGLTGFGGGGTGNLGRSFDIGGALFGNAADFSTATTNLVTSGGFEDGYSAIDFILGTYPSTAGTSTTLILVTDEDRDDGNAALTFGSISSELNARGINLISVINADFQDADGNPAIATDGSTAFIQDGTGFTTAAYDPATGVVSAAGATEADYIELAFSTPNGCAASLNDLRAGGDAATAFSEVLLQCLTTAATGGGGLIIPLNQYRDSTTVVMENHRAQVRRLAFGPGALLNPEEDMATQNAQVVDDMFSMDGLRGYAMVTGYSGDYDAYQDNVGLDYDGYGIIVGADHTQAIASGIVRFGASVGYGELDADLKETRSSLDTDSTTLQLYAAYARPDGFYTQGNLQYAWHEFDNRRVAGGSTFVGTPDGESYSAEVEVGYRLDPMPLSKDPARLAALHVTPFAALGYENHDVDGYTESNGGVTVASFDEDTAYGRLGLRAMIEQFQQGNRYYGAIEIAGTGNFSGTSQEVPINDGAVLAPISSRDDLRLDIRLEAGADLNENSAIFIYLDGGFADNSEQYAATAGLRLNF
ncbi:autotransporter outer membrane beta-barrel domain-containing protein [Roseovarius sp. D22-M7]|uniref:autotransporter outer membrane beta-barrel domain-containing protein n=1 Tax=Roseovarius sp. D22-M7 TaxID=3127116 RepID=UPI00300FF72B